MKKKKIYYNPSPETHEIVHGPEGDYLRKKRSSSAINSSLQANANETCSGAAKQIVDKLKPFTINMGGRMKVYVSGAMRRAKRLTGHYNYSQLLGFELQREYPLDALYKDQYEVRKEKETIYIDIPVSKGCVKAHNKLISHFYFEAVAEFGDAMIPNSLRVEDDRSTLFTISGTSKSMVSFSFVFPAGVPYLIWLKVGCMEGSQPAQHRKHYGIRVVAVG